MNHHFISFQRNGNCRTRLKWCSILSSLLFVTCFQAYSAEDLNVKGAKVAIESVSENLGTSFSEEFDGFGFVHSTFFSSNSDSTFFPLLPSSNRATPMVSLTPNDAAKYFDFGQVCINDTSDIVRTYLMKGNDDIDVLEPYSYAEIALLSFLRVYENYTTGDPFPSNYISKFKKSVSIYTLVSPAEAAIYDQLFDMMYYYNNLYFRLFGSDGLNYDPDTLQYYYITGQELKDGIDIHVRYTPLNNGNEIDSAMMQILNPNQVIPTLMANGVIPPSIATTLLDNIYDNYPNFQNVVMATRGTGTPDYIRANDTIDICDGEMLVPPFGSYNPFVVEFGVTDTVLYDTVNIVGCDCDSLISWYVNVFQKPVITITADPGLIIAPGVQVTLEASGADTYLWGDGTTTSTLVVTPMANTTYFVEGFNAANGCSTVEQVTITVQYPAGEVFLNPFDIPDYFDFGKVCWCDTVGPRTYTMTAVDLDPNRNYSYAEVALLSSSSIDENFALMTGDPFFSDYIAKFDKSATNVSIFDNMTDPNQIVVYMTLFNAIYPSVSYRLFGAEGATYSPDTLQYYYVSGQELLDGIDIHVNYTPLQNANPVDSASMQIQSPTPELWAALMAVYPAMTPAIVGGLQTYVFANYPTFNNVNMSTKGMGVDNYERREDIMACVGDVITWSPVIGLEHQFVALNDTVIADTVPYAGHCCDSLFTLYVDVNPIPNVAITIPTTDTVVLLGSTINIVAEGADNYVWNTGDITSAIAVTPTATTTYIVEGWSNGCFSSDTVIVFVRNNMNGTVFLMPSDTLGHFNFGETCLCDTVGPRTYNLYGEDLDPNQRLSFAELFVQYWENIDRNYSPDVQPFPSDMTEKFFHPFAPLPMTQGYSELLDEVGTSVYDFVFGPDWEMNPQIDPLNYDTLLYYYVTGQELLDTVEINVSYTPLGRPDVPVDSCSFTIEDPDNVQAIEEWFAISPNIYGLYVNFPDFVDVTFAYRGHSVLHWTVNETLEACYGDTVSIRGLGDWVAISDTLFTDTIPSLVAPCGCDSVFNIQLVVNPLEEWVDSVYVCNGEFVSNDLIDIEGFDIPGFVAVNDTIIVDTISLNAPAFNGCSRIIQKVNVYVIHLPEIEGIFGDLDVCYDETTSLSVTATPDDGILYQWFDAAQPMVPMSATNVFDTPNLQNTTLFGVRVTKEHTYVRFSTLSPVDVNVGDIVTTDSLLVKAELWPTAALEYGKIAAGIVFYKDDISIRILSLDETSNLPWGFFGVDVLTLPNLNEQTLALNDYNGLTNTESAIAFNGGNIADDQAFGWAIARGQGWYLPSAGEMNEIGMQKDILNTSIRLLSGTSLSEEWYWTSSEHDLATAWHLEGDGTLDFGAPKTRTDNMHVRAASAFDYANLHWFRIIEKNCDTILFAMVEVNPEIQINIVKDDGCTGQDSGTATANVTGGTPFQVGESPYLFVWNTVPEQTTQTVVNLAPGTYTVTVSDSIGCFSSVDVVIAPMGDTLTVDANVVHNVSCFGGSDGSAIANVSGGTAEFTFEWNTDPIQTTQTAVNLSAGTYSVTVTDQNGCQAVNSVEITQPDAALALQVVTVSNIDCNGGDEGSVTVVATGGTPEYNYEWNTVPAQFGPEATGLTVGVYTVTVFDAMGCTASLDVTISENENIQLVITPVGPICFGETGTAEVVVTGGIQPYTYLWNTIPPQNSATAIGLEAGETYTVIVTDALGCIKEASVTMNNPDPFFVEIDNFTNPTCFGSSDGTATATVTGGTPTFTYLWSDGQTTLTAVGLSAGTYDFTATDGNGCVTSTQVTLIDPAALNAGSIALGADSILINCTAQTIASVLDATSGGGTGAVVYRWKCNGTIIDGATESIFTPGAVYTSVPGTYVFSREANDDCNAGWLPSEGSWSLTVIGFDINGPSSFCEGTEGVTLNVTEGLDGYQWFINGILIPGQNTSTLAVADAGIYTSEGILNGCTVMSQPHEVSIDTVYYIGVAGGSCADNFHWNENNMTYYAADWGYNTLVSDSVVYPGALCDSVIYFQWFFWEHYDDTLTATAIDSVCQNSIYEKNGIILPTNVAGGPFYEVIFDDLSVMYACDSIVYQEYYVMPVYETAVIVDQLEVCQGDSLSWHSINMPTDVAGVFDTTLLMTTVFGCDSLAELQLTVHPILETVISIGGCDSVPFVYGDETLYFAEAGTFVIDTLETVFGCDSIVKVNVNIIGTSFHDSLSVVTCNYYVWETDTLTSTGIYDFNYFGSSGCDSIWTLDLTIHFADTVLDPYTVCQNEEFFWGDNTQYSTIVAGTYYDTLVLTSLTAPYCDSVTILQLTVNPTYETFLQEAACVSYFWPLSGETYYESTTDSVMLQTAQLCDSLVWLNVTIWPTYDTAYYMGPVCEGDIVEYVYENETMTQVVPPTDTLMIPLHYFVQNSPGCDSLVTLKWDVFSRFDTTLFVSGCDVVDLNGLFVYNDSIISETYSGSTSPYCDSVVNYNVTVHQSANETYDGYICHGGLFNDYGFEINTDTLQSGFVYNYLHDGDTTSFGCDSTTMLVLHVLESYAADTIDPVMSCTQYVWGDSVYYESGLYSQTWQTASGCDSIVFLPLTIFPEYNTTYYRSVCQGDYFIDDSLHVSVGPDTTNNVGTYTIVQTLNSYTPWDCDSIVNVVLTVLPIYELSIQDTACQYRPYDYQGFFTQTDTIGTYLIDSLWTTKMGCDSIVHLALSVLPSYNYTIHADACKEEPWEGYNFVFGHDYVDTLGVYTQTLHSTTNPIGSFYCDSIVNLELTVHEIYQTDTYVDTCISYEYIWDWGQHEDLFLTSGVYTRTWHSMTSNYRCDSVVTIHLNLQQMPMVGEIKGTSWVNVAPDGHNGIFDYYIDSVPGCLGYEWFISNEDWPLESSENSRFCSVAVTTETTETLTVRVYNECGFSESYFVIHPTFTAIDDQMENPKFSIYPNPAHNKVNIKLGGIHGETSITVYDGNGNRVDQFVVDVDREGTEMEYNMGHFANGMYMFYISANGHNLTEKVIKK